MSVKNEIYKMDLLLELNPEATIKDWCRFWLGHDSDDIKFKLKEKKIKELAEKVNRAA